MNKRPDKTFAGFSRVFISVRVVTKNSSHYSSRNVIIGKLTKGEKDV